MGNLYYLLWFWGGWALGVVSFCQKLFLSEAGFARFSARLVSAGHAGSWSYCTGSTANGEA